MDTTTNDNTYTALIAAVLRARERTGCDDLAIAVRGDRAAVVLRVPRTDVPGAFSHYVTAFLPGHLAGELARRVDQFTPEAVAAHFQVALSIARDVHRYEALSSALARFRATLCRIHGVNA